MHSLTGSARKPVPSPDTSRAHVSPSSLFCFLNPPNRGGAEGDDPKGGRGPRRRGVVRGLLQHHDPANIYIKFSKKKEEEGMKNASFSALVHDDE